MQIVILDGKTLNPGDLSWAPLEELGEVKVYERTAEHEVAGRCKDADIILTNKAIVNEATINSLDKLKYIGVTATGFNIVDVQAAKRRNIIVTNVPAYGTASVAQLTFSLILEHCFNVGRHAISVREGEWAGSKDFSYWKAPLTELSGKTLGIIGLGQIGQAVARLGLAFGMQVIASHKHPERDKMVGVRFVDLETCFSEADFVSLHCPLNNDNKGFVNKELLARMKPSAFLVNTSRGPLINEADLADALNNNQIAGAGLDVLAQEPPAADNPLLKAKKCIITPHIAWATTEARRRLMSVVIDNVKAFVDGRPQHVVG
ncbi:D-2-hydroxyacid dehydrogenase [Chitinophaga horti]|uniref:D-2-hydroxyacid dehydrogenase n=1 Tax=Chitinophaga horti TaxID=2920382 RepID=A0ABY6J2G0_9BACT|nr:D-2-hydroxyacid dehydrogenase [Chitinophaga horti]UYQ93715.1 D-2-hydroxyacid dehydrogenase [Chitinophaga horti]